VTTPANIDQLRELEQHVLGSVITLRGVGVDRVPPFPARRDFGFVRRRPGYASPVTNPIRRLENKSTCAQFGMDFDYDVGSTLVSLRGELDALSVPSFAGALAVLAERAGHSVTLDLSELRFCNIGGLRAMAELAARLNAIEGRVSIIAPAILTHLLEIADLRSLFVIVDPTGATPAAGSGVDASVSRLSRASRPRASSLHRLPTGS
jgi:anti-anti-sigma factor